jgi:hypothetical protein
MSLAAYFHVETYGIQVSKKKNIEVLSLGKSIFNLIKENHGLHEGDVIAEHMIPTTFNEETEFLSDNNLNSLKRHYMKICLKVRKDFLDYIEDLKVP